MVTHLDVRLVSVTPLRNEERRRFFSDTLLMFLVVVGFKWSVLSLLAG